MAQVRHSWLGELGALQVKLMRSESRQDGAKMAQVLSPTGAIYEDVVEEHQHKLAEERSQHLIHQSPKGSQRIGKIEWHDEELI